MSDTSCNGPPMLSYTVPSTCAPGWSSVIPGFNYAHCNSSGFSWLYAYSCTSSSCQFANCQTTNQVGLDSCSLGMSPRLRSGPHRYKCSDSFTYSPQNVTMIYNITSSTDCSTVYGSLYVYNPTKCIDTDQFYCSPTGVRYSSWSQNGCTGRVKDSFDIPYKSCNLLGMQGWVSIDRCGGPPARNNTELMKISFTLLLLLLGFCIY